MYLDLSRGIDVAASMIWKNQNNGPDNEGAEPRAESPSPDRRAGDAQAAPSGVGARVDTVLQAAERAAADIRRDAEQWAQRHMEDTRRRADELAAQRVQELSSITDDLLSRAQAVARQSDDLINALDAASRRALKVPRRRQDDGGEDPGRPDPEQGPEPADPPSNGPIAPAPRPVSDGARLLVTQMAVAGSNRETISSRLRQEFGIEDPSAILDEAGL